ncbi:N-acetylmuramoyl-L-alanine amidase [Scopulibacillus darangshiensis]|uniref:N-acetylmuramoyl-L-alanine amidase n=1 Tax=Scopulibacillus darangshiensis TaxID=442528 RepID=A0A4R2P548_9BACL|nr:cell wall hydrolase [Scopulibacillus darangshiensis]TCP29797.1 N-acetylmuramoyl-L-alanine amidase [Scopulibacillus darangshiensis]
MAVVKATSADINLLARLLRAEAEGDGVLAMLLVGNVGINRIRADCSDFKGLRTIREMVFQPHAFEATIHGYFYQRARSSEKRLARRVVDGYQHWPAKYSLWYFKPPGACPQTWYDQPKVGRYKAHCFYEPSAETCQNVYNTF